MNGNYRTNLETGRLELHFTKADYKALPDTTKAEIKSACLFSGQAGCWVSRSTNNHWRAERIAEQLGLTREDDVGQRLTFVEQQERKVERAEAQSERMEDHAQNASATASSLFKQADQMFGSIPFGQPILVGHHSERRDRNFRERAANKMDRACEESDKAKYFENRAATARATADQAELRSPAYLQNRIDEAEAQIRGIKRRQDEIELRRPTEGGEQLDQWAKQLECSLFEQQDKLAYYKDALSRIGGVKFSKDNVKPGDVVLIRGRWEKVVRCNPKSVAVTSCFPWPLKYSWAEIRQHKPASTQTDDTSIAVSVPESQ